MKIEIRDLDGKPVKETVDAFETSNPYLCVHPTPFTRGAEFPEFAEGWSITHIPSGASPVCRMPSRVIATAVADWMASQMDWSGGYDEVRKAASTEFKETLHQLIDKTDDYVDSVVDMLELIGKLPEVAEVA